MSGSISNSSATLPLVTPNYETEKADIDTSMQNKVTAQDSFKDYLEQASISVLKDQSKTSLFDPADEIRDKSIYKGTGDSPLA